MDSGNLEVKGVFDAPPALEPNKPPFALTANLRGLRLAEVNRALRAYAKVAVEAGRLSIDAQLDGKDGRYTGSATSAATGVRIRKALTDAPIIGTLTKHLAQGAVVLLERGNAIRRTVRVSGRYAESVGRVDADATLAVAGTTAEATAHLANQLAAQHFGFR